MPMAYVVMSTPVPSTFPTPRDWLPDRDVSAPRGSLLRRGPYVEDVAIEKLQSELSKQRQLTEVLRYEVGQQELEKQKARDAATPTNEVGGSVVENDSDIGIHMSDFCFPMYFSVVWALSSLYPASHGIYYTTQRRRHSGCRLLLRACGCNRVCSTDTLRRAIFIF